MPTIQSHAGGTVPLTPANKPAWYDAVGKLHNKAQEFVRAREILVSKKHLIAPGSKLAQDYNDLISRSHTIENTIKNVTGGVDYIVNMFKGGYNTVASLFKSITGLGFIQVVPLAIIAASTLLIGKWINDAYTFNKRFDVLQKLHDQGVSTGEASQIVGNMNPGFFGGLKSVLIPIAFIGIGIFILPKLLKRK